MVQGRDDQAEMAIARRMQVVYSVMSLVNQPLPRPLLQTDTQQRRRSLRRYSVPCRDRPAAVDPWRLLDSCPFVC